MGGFAPRANDVFDLFIDDFVGGFSDVLISGLGLAQGSPVAMLLDTFEAQPTQQLGRRFTREFLHAPLRLPAPQTECIGEDFRRERAVAEMRLEYLQDAFHESLVLMLDDHITRHYEHFPAISFTQLLPG